MNRCHRHKKIKIKTNIWIFFAHFKSFEVVSFLHLLFLKMLIDSKGTKKLLIFLPALQKIRKKCFSIQSFPETLKNQSSSLYIHWPFCAKRCSYCNFNKYIPKQGVEINNRMTNCLIKELDFYLDYTGKIKSLPIYRFVLHLTISKPIKYFGL